MCRDATIFGFELLDADVEVPTEGNHPYTERNIGGWKHELSMKAFSESSCFFQSEPESHELIRNAMNHSLDPGNILTPLYQGNDLHEKVGFNKITKLRILKQATENL